MKWIPALILALLLIMPPALAVRRDLPVVNVYDPITHKNEPIEQYTYDDLDWLLGQLAFRQWNDLDRVCESMVILFGRASPRCAPVHVAPPGVRPATLKGYVDFEMRPSPFLPPPPTHRNRPWTFPVTSWAHRSPYGAWR